MTRTRIAPTVALACGILALGPGSALGAHVESRGASVRYLAGLGETNHVLVSQSSDFDLVDIVDRGAPLRAGRGCKRVSRHRASCRGYFDAVRVATRDRDDTIRVRRGGPSVTVKAGGGNDRVQGGPGFDEIDGGAGRDVLDGGGGTGFDTVVYSSHRRPVRVHLRDGRPDGSRGEGDVLRRFENIRGGRGADVLTGDQEPNTIEAGSGRDWIDGRGGTDELDGGRGLDFVRCGRGDDLVQMRGGDFVTPDCEGVGFGDAAAGGNQFEPYPRVRRGIVSFRIGCPDTSGEGSFIPCGGLISLRTGRGRLLGRGRIRRHLDTDVVVRVRLTRLGRLLAGRRSGVRTRVLVTGLHLPHHRWRIRLRVPG